MNHSLIPMLAVLLVACGAVPGPTPSTAVDAFQGGSLRSAAGDGHSATLLPDGRVLATTGAWSGMDGATVGSASVEVWDSTTGSFAPGTPFASPRQGHSAIRLANGQLLIVGGRSGAIEFDLNSVEVRGP